MRANPLEDPRFLDVDEVQHFLNYQPLGHKFTVIFLKKDGTQRQIIGHLEEGLKSKTQVPIVTDEGWKSFDISRVLYIN